MWFLDFSSTTIVDIDTAGWGHCRWHEKDRKGEIQRIIYRCVINVLHLRIICRVTIEISCQMDFSQYPFDRWHIQRHISDSLIVVTIRRTQWFPILISWKKDEKSYLQKWRNNLQKIKRIDRILLQAHLLLPSWLL